MAAVLALMWALLAGLVFTGLLAGLYVMTDPQHWRVLRRRAAKGLYRYARQAHLRRRPIRSQIAWVLADLTESRRTTR